MTRAEEHVENVQRGLTWRRGENLAQFDFEADAALSELVADAEALAEALRVVLDCKGWGEGTVSERGGEPAVCTKCEEIARNALARYRGEK